MCMYCYERSVKEEAAETPSLSHVDRTEGPKSRNYAGPFRKTPGRLFGMGFIRFYQLTLSCFIGNSCRHLPTCSEYGYEAIARHGFWRGGWMALFRVMRCGPGGTHGFDPVPEKLDAAKRWWAPWRLWHLKDAR
ncbi:MULTISPECIES: membrane protein insertion efficiency factor YidD [unclassified Rhizobium]|uniref:membrane protein insertion efficiency factor YidD n=1 Tax=unclassified Rhizobium TaxID=2613769 RepID=UPI0006F935F2|nr:MULTISPECIES: membrane protein insertion efficiency factor YidD [unclassified Rhizobium]KQV42530.1 membrane protein insertion efficiency factor YidD [Rhizobium sp. Root1212]KRD21440.1 membrane protein insertion efficiency factor YidD [Rhizobium sp. Root268]